MRFDVVLLLFKQKITKIDISFDIIKIVILSDKWNEYKFKKM